MAATFCNLSPGSGLVKLNEYLLNHRYITGSCLGVPFSDAVKRSSCLCHNTQRLFNRTYKRQLEDKHWRQHKQNSFERRAEYFDTAHEQEKEEDISKATLIWRAIKLPIYSVALVPITVGSAAAYLQTGVFSARRYFMLLASSVLVITWLNLRLQKFMSVVHGQQRRIRFRYRSRQEQERICCKHGWQYAAITIGQLCFVMHLGSRTGTFIAAYSLLALGFIGLTWASLEAGNMRSILLLACAITCGYLYQCPPFRLSYQGLGEPLCFAAFGPFATTAFYLMQSSISDMNYLPLTGTILSVSLLVGFTTTLILFCSHFHQVEGDRAVGKISPLVRLGTKTGSEVVKVSVIVLYSLLFAFGLSRALPLTCIFFGILTLPMGKLVVNYVEENHKDKTKIFMAKYYCVRLHALFGAALAAGLVAVRMIN